jgi:hypothetical protein
MTLDLPRMLVVGNSLTAFFNLKEVDRMFRDLREVVPDEVIDRYCEDMQKREDEPLPGGLEGFLKALA